MFLSGARSFRGLLAPAAWRRLAGPLAALVAVFAVVVLPVAALDLRAFWGDIVAYNVGLPGADNYPLGGTPGFGFANFLIYFGRVTSLRDYFPFSVFYLLLIPLGLLLVRSQLRDGRAEWALATGTAALLASLYFSRVVHPNYLVPVAVLLPVAVLACRRGAHVALVPLLLLAVAVEAVEGGVFRTAWEQAAEAGLFARAGGVVAALAPRAGPQLTRDPLGLLFGALAAGLAVSYLAAAVTGAGPRLRSALRATAVLVVVLVPTLALVAVSDRTGLVRAQDPAVVQASADAGRLASGRSPYSLPAETTPRGREAFATSFRLDPPAELEPERPLLPPGPALLALGGRLIGPRDLRVVVLLALALLAGAVAAATRGVAREAALAVVLLSPPVALGAALGCPVLLPLCALVAAWALARRGQVALAGVLAGLAVATDHRALLAAVPLLAAPAASARVRGALAATIAYAAVVLPVVLLDPAAFLVRLEQPGESAPVSASSTCSPTVEPTPSPPCRPQRPLSSRSCSTLALYARRGDGPRRRGARCPGGHRPRARAPGGGGARADRAAHTGGRGVGRGRSREARRARLSAQAFGRRADGEGWCRRRDSNPHGFLHTPLKRACLPIPPLRHAGRDDVERTMLFPEPGAVNAMPSGLGLGWRVAGGGVKLTPAFPETVGTTQRNRSSRRSGAAVAVPRGG